MRSALARYAVRVLGGCSVLDARSTSGGSQLLEVVDAAGERWFVKQVGRVGLWRGEVRAYHRWVPVLGDRAPVLRDADARLQAIVLSAVPGRRGRPGDLELHRQAGEVLRVFHRARPPRPAPDGYLSWMTDRLEDWLSGRDDLFSSAETRFAREQTRRLQQLPPLSQVPCHGDYRPYNWIQDDAGVVRVIDFGGARRHVWAFDLTRLYLGPWWGRPGLATAFLSGYDRQPSEQDRAFIQLCGASQLVIQIAWARQHGVPDVERRSRQRLAQLMDGRPVVSSMPPPTQPPPSRFRRLLRRPRA